MALAGGPTAGGVRPRSAAMPRRRNLGGETRRPCPRAWFAPAAIASRGFRGNKRHPEVEHSGVELREAEQRAKGDVAVLSGWQRSDGWGIGRKSKTTKTAGEAEQLLGETSRLVGRVGHRVGEVIIDRGQAGGVGIAKITDLQRRGTQGESLQAMMGRMTRQVDQNIDFVGLDLRRLAVRCSTSACCANHWPGNATGAVILSGQRSSSYKKICTSRGS